jgi:zinc/manganese transport system ATP-binding protein
MTAAITLKDLTLAYDREPAVHHLTGTFERGSQTAIVGPNGAGKSTLLKAIAGLMRAHEGEISLAGCAPREVAYLPQRAEIDRSFPISVWDSVALGLWHEVGPFRSLDASQRARVHAALAAVGAEGPARHPVGTLSVGQFQRVLFARLLVQDAAIILLDEPFAALDERTTADLLQILERWHAEGRTIVAVLHDLELIREHFPTSLLMARAPVAWGPKPQVLTRENLGRARSLAGGWSGPVEIDSVLTVAPH